MATSRPPDRNARIVDAVGREVYERLKEETPLCGSVLDRLPAHLRAGTPEPLDSVAHRSLYAHMPVEIRAAARQKPLRVILEAADEDALTNLKVQKLCYYAAGLIAAVRGQGGKPLFREQIEAWQHGPVVPTEYFRFSQFGGSAIPPQVNFDDELIEPRDLAVSNDVYGYYGQYSA